ncbi:sensor histidine kinase [Cellulomonas hominis]|uniref:sensor histidine kinase n=1 Tax=Cellulomonas hominis TaxID=156981 RepID=UPI0027DFE58C|nr:HAMP domain-containing sensor histidine kinase [Cellulomonas hominis]
MSAPTVQDVPVDAVPEPPDERRRAGVLEPLRSLWARTPLLARLVGITTVLLATGLAIAGASTTTLLSSFLMGQFDKKVAANNETYADQLTRAYNEFGSLDPLKSLAWGSQDYALRAELYGEVFAVSPGGDTSDDFGTPRLPSVDPSTLTRASWFTVPSDSAGSAWRGIITPITVRGSTVGYMLYAEPLGDVQSIVRRAAVVLWTSALAILVIGAIVATWAVKRSLRGLREIESTAAQIAAGDLSQRVPPAPETTEVGRLGAALNSMLGQIEAAFDDRTRSEERMRRFVADASHELRTPLAAIRGYGELYRMGALTEKEQVDDTMRRIEQSATRMGGLVEDLLALARLDANRPGRTDPVDLAVLATDAAHDLRALDPGRDVRVGPLDGGTGGPTVVRGDESRLRQVLANLIGNVARHTPAGTPAELAVGRTGDRVVVEVRDHGPGIAPEHARRVFERFYRVDASRTREGNGTGGGAGLGMAIVAAIVEAHHGEVAIAQTPGGGATVRVALPADDPAADPRPEDHPPA